MVQMNNSVNRMTNLLLDYLVNFINPTQIEANSPFDDAAVDKDDDDDDFDNKTCVLSEIEQYIDYLDRTKTYQLITMQKAFNLFQIYFKLANKKCDTILYNKPRCFVLIVSLYGMSLNDY